MLMNKILQTRVHLKVSELQLPLHKNYTSRISFIEKSISRDLLEVFRAKWRMF